MPADTEERQHARHLEYLDELAENRGIRVERDVPIGPWTTLRVGGAADRVVTADSVETLVAALELGRDAGVSVGVLGKGSDIVVADRGIRGLVVRNRADTIAVSGTRLRASSGAAMAALVKRCITDGLTGLEFGISIPGSLGGAVWANAGAHDGEMADVIHEVRVWDDLPQDEASRRQRSLSNAECGFAYRDSRFKRTGEVVVEAVLDLEHGDRDAIASAVASHQAQRRATQPIADQNAGSVFRNPPGDHAGRLIDAAGLKGFQIGSASVSTLHANFIVADRGGKAVDVRAVGDHVRAVVADRFGVELAYEIEFVGEWPSWPDATPSFLAGVM